MFARRRSIARTTSRGSGGPTPAAWETRRFSWSAAASSGPMTVVDSTADCFYRDEKAMAFAWADAINREARLLDAARAALKQVGVKP